MGVGRKADSVLFPCLPPLRIATIQGRKGTGKKRGQRTFQGENGAWRRKVTQLVSAEPAASRRRRSDQRPANSVAPIHQRRRPGHRERQVLQPVRRDLLHGGPHRHAQYQLLRDQLRLRFPRLTSRPTSNSDSRQSFSDKWPASMSVVWRP